VHPLRPRQVNRQPRVRSRQRPQAMLRGLSRQRYGAARRRPTSPGHALAFLRPRPQVRARAVNRTYRRSHRGRRCRHPPSRHHRFDQVFVRWFHPHRPYAPTLHHRLRRKIPQQPKRRSLLHPCRARAHRELACRHRGRQRVRKESRFQVKQRPGRMLQRVTRHNRHPSRRRRAHRARHAQTHPVLRARRLRVRRVQARQARRLPWYERRRVRMLVPRSQVPHLRRCGLKHRRQVRRPPRCVLNRATRRVHRPLTGR
jgi:hypothetical protein